MDKMIDYALWLPRVLSVLRIVTALLFLEHGTGKLFDFPHTGNPGPALASLLGVQGLIEFIGGLLLLAGFYTRLVAFILCGDMAVAYFIAHFPRNFFPLLNSGEAAILYCFIFLTLAVAGGGAWSVDAGRSKAAG